MTKERVTATLPEIQRAHLMKGGWEVWAQVELAMAFEDRIKHDGGHTTEVERELQVYEGSADKAVLSFTTDRNQNNEFSTVIELKCERNNAVSARGKRTENAENPESTLQQDRGMSHGHHSHRGNSGKDSRLE